MKRESEGVQRERGMIQGHRDREGGFCEEGGWGTITDLCSGISRAVLVKVFAHIWYRNVCVCV